MGEMLIVPSPTLVPLSTAVPVPTDGQPHHFACDKCETRVLPGDIRCTACQSDQIRPDGPFLFTVGVWQEVRCYTPDKCHAAWCGDEVCARGFGAVVATVEVTGPSHHAKDCARCMCASGDGSMPAMARCFAESHVVEYCHPDTAGDCWHTPIGEVTPLDVPIPMERPTSYHDAEADVTVCDVSPAFWWADLTVKAGR